MTEKKQRRLFLGLQGLLLLLLAAAPLWMLLADSMPGWMVGCFLHDRFFLYCPVCGGTRALMALLRLDLLSALALNPFVTLCALGFLVIDLLAWGRWLHKKNPFIRIPSWVWISLAVGMILYGVLRNYLMIAHGIDPTGDLVGFWDAVRKR